MTAWASFDWVQVCLWFTRVQRVGTTTVYAEYWLTGSTSHLRCKWSWTRFRYAWKKAAKQLPQHSSGRTLVQLVGCPFQQLVHKVRVPQVYNHSRFWYPQRFRKLSCFLLLIVLSQLGQAPTSNIVYWYIYRKQDSRSFWSNLVIYCKEYSKQFLKLQERFTHPDKKSFELTSPENLW